MHAHFVTFEGGEGSGKSTQIARLAEALKASGLAFHCTREPGGSSGAERIRELLVTGGSESWTPLAETLLFCAARAEHVERVIKPTLQAGIHVLCDRFFDSTLVYQGIGKGMGEAYIQHLHHHILGGFSPSLTLIFDISPEQGLARAASRRGNETRFESLPIDFHHAVRAGFLSIARREPERCVVIDASADADTVHQSVISTLQQHLGWTLR